VLKIGDAIAFGRDAQVTHITADLAQHVADGILEPIFARDLADDGELRTIRRPIRLAHAFLNLTRSAAAQGHTRQRAGEESKPHVPGIQKDSQFTLG